MLWITMCQNPGLKNLRISYKSISFNTTKIEDISYKKKIKSKKNKYK